MPHFCYQTLQGSKGTLRLQRDSFDLLTKECRLELRNYHLRITSETAKDKYGRQAYILLIVSCFQFAALYEGHTFWSADRGSRERRRPQQGVTPHASTSVHERVTMQSANKKCRSAKRRSKRCRTSPERQRRVWPESTRKLEDSTGHPAL